MVDDEIFKKVSNLILLVLASLAISLCVRHTYAEEIPPLPDEAKNVLPLDRTFEPAIGNGIKYLNDGRVLQMSDAPSEAGAIWSKTKLDLRKPFNLTGYIYLGNQKEKAGDGLTFCMQNLGKDYIGEFGQGIGAYKSRTSGIPEVVALEFDTFFNENGADNSDDLPDLGNHIAFCMDHTDWSWGQQHNAVSQLPSREPGVREAEYLSNGAWKKVVIQGQPVGEEEVELSYKVTDLGSSKSYENKWRVDYGYNQQKPRNYAWGLTNEVYWGFTSSTGANWETSALAFKSLPQTAIINTRDVTISKGRHWDPSQNFVSARDENGAPIWWGDSRLTSTNNVKTDTPGTYEVTYYYMSVDGLYTQRATAKVTVLEDKTSIKTRDTILRVGEKWDPAANFVSAADEAGNSVPWGDSRIDINDATVDTTKPGVTHLKYTIKGKHKTVDSSFTVTVLENKTSIKTRDTTLRIGQKWNPEDNFVSATDESGASVLWSDPRIDVNAAAVDITEPKVNHLTYTMRGKGKNVDSSFTVTVIPPVQLSVPATCDFGTYRLGDSNPVLPWKKSSKVEVTGEGSTQWQLSVSLNSGSSLKGYLKLGNKLLSEQSQKVINGSGPMDVTERISSEDFIKVDYTGVKEKRKDTGVLEWNLTPPIKKVRE
ncbi:bacterial Ig-like domain-containing protein [Lactococcus garvieae]|uniref:bacterial Ig-like domain-containing protein n=1 Tax=Lactococcus garvieae TaxID=1363 RepID=UPI003D776584